MQKIKAVNGIVFFRSDILKSPHGFSTREGGRSTVDFLSSCNLGPSKDEDRSLTYQNIRIFCEAIGTDAERLTTPNQVHSVVVLKICESDVGTGGLSPFLHVCDGLLTNIKGSCVGSRSADCVPVLLEGRDDDGKVLCVCSVHSGWRGTAAGIVKNAVELMVSEGIKSKNIYAAIGPHIGSCCFETRDDCREVFLREAGEWVDGYIEKRKDRYFPDLTKINLHWLEMSGVPAENTDACNICTCCNPELFYSYRRTGQKRGSMLSVIGI